jgi:hypothetical protein
MQAPAWYVAYQAMVFGTGLILVSIGAFMTYRRIHLRDDGKWLHGVMHGIMMFNGCVYLVWGVDPWCLNHIYSWQVPPLLRNLLNITVLSGLLLWTSVLLEGIKDVEGKLYSPAMLRILLWKVPTVFITILSFSCQIWANQKNLRWPLGIIAMSTLTICSIAALVASRALLKVTEIFSKSQDHMSGSQSPQQSQTSGSRNLVILKLKGTLIALGLQILIAIYNSIDFLRSHQSLEEYEVPQDISRPFFPTTYLIRAFVLPIIVYLFWISPPTTGKKHLRTVSTSPSSIPSPQSV